LKHATDKKNADMDTPSSRASPEKGSGSYGSGERNSGQRSLRIFQSTDAVPLLAIVLAMAVLGFLQLDRRDFWGDEALTVLIVRMPWNEFADSLVHESNMWLYYFLMRPWLHLGSSEWLVRVPSVLFAIAAVASAYTLGKRMFSSAAGLAAALLLSINAFHLRYAQETRSYSLLVLLSILAGWCFVRAIERPTQDRLAAYILTSTLAFYTHLFAIQLVMVHALSLAFLPRQRLPWRRLALAFACIALLCSPLLYLAFFLTTARLTWVDPLRPIEIYKFLFTLTGSGGVALLLVYGLLVAIALVKAIYVWRRSGRSFELWRYAFLTTWIALPIVLTALVSFFATPIFVDRYLILSLPGLVLLAGTGLASIRPPRLAVAIAVLLLGLSTPGVRRVYAVPYAEWRAATAYVLSQTRPGDGLVFEPRWPWLTFELYSQLYSHESEAPKELPISRNLLGIGREHVIAEEVPRLYSRIWLIMSHFHKFPHEIARQRVAQERLGAVYGRIEEKNFSDIRVLLYSWAPDYSGREGARESGSSTPGQDWK
jgi:hypothetical protein